MYKYSIDTVSRPPYNKLVRQDRNVMHMCVVSAESCSCDIEYRIEGGTGKHTNIMQVNPNARILTHKL